MLNLKYTFTAVLENQEGNGTWHFVHMPHEESAEIKSFTNPKRRGWGAVKVHVTIGKTAWDTSIFPDGNPIKYFLPIKKEVRTKEHLEAGQSIEVQIDISL